MDTSNRNVAKRGSAGAEFITTGGTPFPAEYVVGLRGEPKAKNTQDGVGDLKGTLLNDRGLESQQNSVPQLLVGTDTDNVVREEIVDGQEGIDRGAPEGDFEGQESEEDIVASLMCFMDEFFADLVEDSPIVSVSTLESELESMFFEDDGNIMVSVDEGNVDDLRKLIDLLGHAGYANKLALINYVSFDICFAKHKDKSEDIQALLDLLVQLPNLKYLNFQDIPGELSGEAPNCGIAKVESSIILEDFIAQNTLTFCDKNIKLNLRKNKSLASLTCKNGTFNDNYVVKLPHPGLEIENPLRHKWALNCNLIQEWCICSKTSKTKSYYRLPSKDVSMEEWISKNCSAQEKATFIQCTTREEIEAREEQEAQSKQEEMEHAEADRQMEILLKETELKRKQVLADDAATKQRVERERAQLAFKIADQEQAFHDELEQKKKEHQQVLAEKEKIAEQKEKAKKMQEDAEQRAFELLLKQTQNANAARGAVKKS